VITAERRTTALQKTAIAAKVVTGKDLIAQHVVTVDQLQFISPSLTVNNFGQGNDADIRGIGKGEHNSQTGTGVVTYRDGVPTFPGYFQEEPYYDIASVEVLRGPQGTFSGQNATGGAIIVNSNNPVIDGGYDGYVYARYGNYNDVNLQGAVNIPINDTLAARIAWNGEYRDSFFKVSGPWTGDPDPKWGSLRFSLLWTPNSQLKVLFKTDYNYLDNGAYFGPTIINPVTGNPNGTNNLFNFSNNFHTSAIDQFMRSVLKIDYTTQSGIDFRSVTGVQWGRSAWTGDIEDLSNTPPPAYMIDEGVDETLWTQEFNVISPADKPITWVLGAFYQNNTYNFPYGRFDIGLPFGGYDDDLFGVNRTWSAAAFGQVSFNLPAGFQLQAGVRYSAWSTLNKATFYVPEYLPFLFAYQNETENGDNTTGKITLNWNLDSHNFLYAFVASGAKPGGLNTAVLYLSSFSYLLQPPFKQEYVWDYEIGWKSSLFDNHVHLQLGGYYNDFKHFQVSLYIPDNPTQTTEYNVPNTTVLYGMEASIQAAFGGFSLSGDLGLEKSKLGTFYAVLPGSALPGPCDPFTGPASSTCFDLQGHPQTYAPEVTFNIEAAYRFKLASGDTITPSVSFAHISDQWGTVFDITADGDHLGPRNLLNASIAWVHGAWTLTAFGTNLMNDQYISALVSPLQIPGNPRQYGVSIMKTF
jgi:iron complex outermembrane recepter protein